MEVYLRVFLNWELNNWAKFLRIVEFAYNNFKSASTGHTLLELNYGYHPCVFFEDEVNLCSKSGFADIMAKELRELMSICQQNLLYTQEPQKQVHSKVVKPYSYALDEKI